MAWQKKGKGRRRGNRRRGRGRNPTTNIVRAPTGLPDRTFVKLKYVDSFNLSSTSTLALAYYHSSMFDPLNTMGGHQPLGYDEYTQFYQKGCVLGMQVTLSGQCQTGTPTVFMYAGTSSAAPANIVSILEKPYVKHKSLKDSGDSKFSFTSYYSSAKIHGINKSEVMDTQYQETLGVSNPPVSWDITFGAQDADLTSAHVTKGTITIIFYACLFDRKRLVQS